MSYNKPLPKINADTRPFWSGCKEHGLRFQRCKECGFVRWPPSIICPKCHSKNTEWIVASGRGKVYTYVVYHMAYHQGFKDELPYVVAIIELEEGPHFLSNIVGCGPDKVKIDMPVEIEWEDVTEEFSLPKFKPV
ncbi:MAG: Zn-ribbon domain-containing OB-fold protein [Thermodesulfobacteriota bacterium]|nr:Zn-ribbon domain-containing OB-fold protein [Thermodesulfobacteriota bacterium]